LETVEANPSVGDAVVLAEEDGGDVRLIACVAKAEGAVTVHELREHLRGLLPESRMPASFTVLDCLPMTGNGETDPTALKVVPPETGDGGYAGSELECIIAGIWREVLRVERVGMSYNFFDVGGDSLMLIKVHSELESRLGHSLPVVDLFQYPTVQALAAHLGRTPPLPSSLVEVRARATRQRAAMQRAMHAQASEKSSAAVRKPERQA
jgi:acyl carrier protein